MTNTVFSLPKPLYLYFKEMVLITDKLATWEPSNNPKDLPGAAKDLDDLSGKIKETIQAFEVNKNETLIEEESTEIVLSLDQILSDVFDLTQNVMLSKLIFINLNTTEEIVFILQDFNNQFSILFDLVEKFISKDQMSKLLFDVGNIICLINKAIGYLNNFTCQPQGLKFCDCYARGKEIPLDPKRICINNQFQGDPSYEQMCLS